MYSFLFIYLKFLFCILCYDPTPTLNSDVDCTNSSSNLSTTYAVSQRSSNFSSCDTTVQNLYSNKMSEPDSPVYTPPSSPPPQHSVSSPIIDDMALPPPVSFLPTPPRPTVVIPKLMLKPYIESSTALPAEDSSPPAKDNNPATNLKRLPSVDIKLTPSVPREAPMIASSRHFSSKQDLFSIFASQFFSLINQFILLSLSVFCRLLLLAIITSIVIYLWLFCRLPQIINDSRFM
jgi:hypothetical protein